MAKTDIFFENLVGIHDIRSNGGSLLPRRSTINIKGGRAEDIGGVTQLSGGTAAVWKENVHVTIDLDDATFPGFNDASDVALTPIGGRDITGFELSGVTILRKRIWNISPIDSLSLLHDDAGSSALNRIITPDGLTMVIAVGEVVSIQRSAANANWRAYRCLI